MPCLQARTALGEELRHVLTNNLCTKLLPGIAWYLGREQQAHRRRWDPMPCRISGQTPPPPTIPRNTSTRRPRCPPTCRDSGRPEDHIMWTYPEGMDPQTALNSLYVDNAGAAGRPSSLGLASTRVPEQAYAEGGTFEDTCRENVSFLPDCRSHGPPIDTVPRPPSPPPPAAHAWLTCRRCGSPAGVHGGRAGVNRAAQATGKFAILLVQEGQPQAEAHQDIKGAYQLGCAGVLSNTQ